MQSIQLGLKENWKQFTLLVIVNAFVGGMVGLERSILPLLAEDAFQMAAKTAILSFIIVFGVVKALTNYFTGTLANQFGRKRLLIAGWIIGLPVPFLLIYAPSWNWIIVANVLLGINQGLTWSSTVVMKIDLVGEKKRGFAMGLNEFAGYIAVAGVAFLTGWLAASYAHMGRRYIQTLQGRAVKDPANEVLNDLLTAIQYETYLYDGEEARAAETRWGNVQEFVAWLSKKGEASTEYGNESDGKNLLELTQLVSLITMLEGREDSEPDAVKLSTLHASKGLEYGHVFLIGCEEGILPHTNSIDADQIEEERRLMYVGITRAQKSLNITWCKKRKRAGEMQACEPSRFIAEMPKDDVKHFGNPFNGADQAVSKEYGKSKMANIKAMLNQKQAQE